jgi:hypothetical protein
MMRWRLALAMQQFCQRRAARWMSRAVDWKILAEKWRA